MTAKDSASGWEISSGLVTWSVIGLLSAFATNFEFDSGTVFVNMSVWKSSSGFG